MCRYIIQEGNKLETGQVKVPMNVTNAVHWRGENINYRKNEVFLDVIENVDLLVSMAMETNINIYSITYVYPRIAFCFPFCFSVVWIYMAFIFMRFKIIVLTTLHIWYKIANISFLERVG